MIGAILAAAVSALAYLSAGWLVLYMAREFRARDALDWANALLGGLCVLGLAILGSMMLPAWAALGQG